MIVQFVGAISLILTFLDKKKWNLIHPFTSIRGLMSVRKLKTIKRILSLTKTKIKIKKGIEYTYTQQLTKTKTNEI